MSATERVVYATRFFVVSPICTSLQVAWLVIVTGPFAIFSAGI
jgi:hypothetical protein